MFFSQRMGLSPVRVEIQLHDMDKALRVALWNVSTEHHCPRQKESIHGLLAVDGVLPDPLGSSAARAGG